MSRLYGTAVLDFDGWLYADTDMHGALVCLCDSMLLLYVAAVYDAIACFYADTDMCGVLLILCDCMVLM